MSGCPAIFPGPEQPSVLVDAIVWWWTDLAYFEFDVELIPSVQMDDSKRPISLLMKSVRVSEYICWVKTSVSIKQIQDIL